MYYGVQLPVIYLTEAASARANVMLLVTSFFFKLFGGINDVGTQPVTLQNG